MKEFIEPEVEIIELEDDVIATSTGCPMNCPDDCPLNCTNKSVV